MKQTKNKGIKVRIVMLVLAAFGTALAVSMPVVAEAAAGQGMQGLGISRPLVMLTVLAALSMVPFVVMMSTSFVKIAVVLSLIRNALGTQQVPPNIVVTGLALILTIYVMMPVGYDVYRSAGSVINQGTNQPLLSQVSVELMVKAVEQGKEPVRQFLIKHVHAQERSLFYNLALKLTHNDEDRAKITDQDFVNLIPAFCISELTEAFQIGFVIFLPFLIIDIVVANILLSLGMFQISPITLSLPFKLLLFVLVDGWHLITKGLILGYV